MKVRFLENCAGREKGTVEDVNDGMGTIWVKGGQAQLVKKKEEKKEEKKKDLKDPRVTRHFAG
ncbi:unnamed protein product, partial [marine sediment metagenome]